MLKMSGMVKQVVLRLWGLVVSIGKTTDPTCVVREIMNEVCAVFCYCLLWLDV